MPYAFAKCPIFEQHFVENVFVWHLVSAMKRASVAQAERAKRLLASEGGPGGSAEACAAAAGQVYDKLDAHLSSLLGRTGVQALFARSARLVETEFPCLAEVAAGIEVSAKLRACLQSLEPAVAIEAAAVLFGTFLELLTTFIGDRLTVQVLRSAWPAIEEMSPRETHK